MLSDDRFHEHTSNMTLSNSSIDSAVEPISLFDRTLLTVVDTCSWYGSLSPQHTQKLRSPPDQGLGC